MQRPPLIDVVLPFHAGDQQAAARLLEVLMAAKEGKECRYHLRYGDPDFTLTIGATLDRFMAARTATLSTAPPRIDAHSRLTADEPEVDFGPGPHTIRTVAEKRKILQWNRVVFEAIEGHDAVLILEPDCVVLKNGWFSDIATAWVESRTPIFGHLKRGRIDGREVPTHWAGCSVYDGPALRSLELDRTFRERFPNPWWRYRERPNTGTANNPFWGPHASAWDLSFDYLLFILYWRERSGHADAIEWPVERGLDRSDLIWCDPKTRLSAAELLDRHWGTLSLFHGAKDDQVRLEAAERFGRLGRADSRSVPVGRGPRALGEGANEERHPLQALRGRYRDQRVFIIGNGPSLKVTDLRPLANEFTIGLNRIYLNYDRMGFEPTFYCAVNPHVLEQFADDISALRSVKFLNEKARPWLYDHRNTFFMRSTPKIGFAEDLAALAWHEGWTVTYCALQVAFHLGFDEVILVGVDHYFERTGAPDLLVVESGDDVNHFHPGYFGSGVRWQYPNLERSEQSYRLARSVYERHHRRVRDATIGGRLTVFEKTDYATLLVDPMPRSPAPPVVSIIMPVRNGEDTIREAIRSVQTQDLEAWELLVVDDHSSDATAVLVLECARLDARIRYSRNEGSGVSMARNQGLEEARGEFITFLDADDLYYDWALSARVESLQGNLDRVAVYCQAEVVGTSGDPLGWQIGAGLVTFKDAWRNPFHLAALMGRATFLKSFRFDPRFQPAEDYRFAVQILRAGAEIDMVESCRVAYRLRADSTVARDPRALEDAFVRVLDTVYGQDPSCPSPLGACREGLISPDRRKVEQRRQAALLMSHLLTGRAELARAVVSRLAGFMFEPEEIEIHLRRAVARHYRCPLRHAWAAFRERGRAALDLATSLELRDIAPAMHVAILDAVAAAEPRPVEALAGPIERGASPGFDEIRMIHELLKDTSPSDAVMVDVGAHRGGSLDRFVQSGWLVHAFEPDALNRDFTAKRFFDASRLNIDPRAVSSVIRERVPWWEAEGSDGISSLTPFTSRHRLQGRVGTTTLGAFTAERAIPRVEFLKVDVEGHEMMVLQGTPWDRLRPRVILCEFEDRKTAPHGFDHFRLGDFLLEKGYRVLTSEWHPVVRYGTRHDWRRLAVFPGELLDAQGWGNLIAFRDPQDLESFRAIVSRSISTPASSDVPGGDSVPEPVFPMLQTPPETPRAPASPIGWRDGLLRLRGRLVAVGGVSTVASAGLALAALVVDRYSTALLALAVLVFLTREAVRARRLDRLLGHREGLERDLRRRVTDLDARLRRSDSAAVAEANRVAEDMGRLAAKARGELRRYGARVRAMGGVNAALFRPHERELSKDALDRIRTVWLPRLGLDLSPEALGYMAHRIGTIEDRCQGRLAAAIDTEVLRCLVARAAGRRSLEVLEVGALFGVHACCVHDLSRDNFETTHVTLIDALDGGHVGRVQDPIVGLPITRLLLSRNLRAADVPDEDWTLIQRAPEDPEARAQAALRSYDVLYIGGDRGLERVRFELQTYGPLVRPGGLIVLDDYGVPAGPDLGTFLDEARVELLGADWMNVILRIKPA